MKTPTEICADRIRDLEAQLQMADERNFYLAAENARLRDSLITITSDFRATTRDCEAWSGYNKAMQLLHTPTPTRITPSGVPFIPER